MSLPPPAVATMSAPPPATAAEDEEIDNVGNPETEEYTDNRMFSTYGLDFLCCFNSCFILPERTSMVQLFFGNYNAIDVSNPFQFVADQAPAVLKRVVGKFPYETNATDQPSLRSETTAVSKMMREALQRRCNVAGIRIESFSINELSYAPEIAQSMLRRQQAEAMIEARQRLVQGATGIAKSAAMDPELRELVNDADRSRMIANLLVVLVSERDASPVVPL